MKITRKQLRQLIREEFAKLASPINEIEIGSAVEDSVDISVAMESWRTAREAWHRMQNMPHPGTKNVADFVEAVNITIEHLFAAGESKWAKYLEGWLLDWKEDRFKFDPEMWNFEDTDLGIDTYDDGTLIGSIHDDIEPGDPTEHIPDEMFDKRSSMRPSRRSKSADSARTARQKIRV